MSSQPEKAVSRKKRHNGHRPYGVLVMDDDPKITEWLKAELEFGGFRCWCAHDGKTALDYCAELKPDAAILDLDLGIGSLSGTDVLWSIKQDLKLSSTVVFILTGTADRRVEELCMDEYGADGYFIKGKTEGTDIVCALRAWLRQIKVHNTKNEFSTGPLRINYAEGRAYVNNKMLPLTPMEYNLLTFVAKKSPRVAGWDTLARKLWKMDGEFPYRKAPSLVAVCQARLKSKLGIASQYMETIRHDGLRLIKSSN